MIKGLGHIGVFVTDIEKSRKFYEEILEFKVTSTYEDPGAKIVFASAGTCIVELVQLTDFTALPEGVVNHIALEVPDLGEAMDWLAAKGIKFDFDAPVVNEKMAGGVTYMFFRGPDDEKIEIMQFL